MPADTKFDADCQQWSAQLLSLLRETAARHLSGERRGIRFKPTEQFTDAYLRLVEIKQPFVDRTYLARVASTQMRWVLIDRARSGCFLGNLSRPFLPCLRMKTDAWP